MKAIGKIIKFLLVTVLVLFVLALALVLSVPLWFGPVVRPSLCALVPHYTKTGFSLRELYLNPYTCHIRLGGLRLENPSGFSEPDALHLDGLDFDVDTASLAEDTVIIENLAIDGLYFSDISDAQGRGNFDVIADNFKGHHDKLAAESTPEERLSWQEIDDFFGSFRAPSTNAVARSSAPDGARPINRKLIIRHFELRNTSGTYGKAPVKIPSITLENIGGDSGGYDLDHLNAALAKEIWASLLASGVDVKNLAVQGFEALESVGVKDAGKAVDATRNALKKVNMDEVKKAADQLKGLFR